jgi:hypothetical protein
MPVHGVNTLKQQPRQQHVSMQQRLLQARSSYGSSDWQL